MPIGSIIQGAAALQNSFANIGFGIADRLDSEKWNWINQKNWEDTFKYQKSLNDILMAREDNAVQRKAADLAAAGINPMLAGLGGASAMPGNVINPLQQSAPQWREGMGEVDVAGVGEALNKLKEIKSHEKNEDENRLAAVQLLEKQLESQNLSQEEQIKANQAINAMNNIFELIKQRNQLNSEEDRAQKERDIKWAIENHKSLKNLVEKIPIIGPIFSSLIDSATGDKWEPWANDDLTDTEIDNMFKEFNNKLEKNDNPIIQAFKKYFEYKKLK